MGVYTELSAVVNGNTNGNNTLVEAVSGYKIRILGLSLVAAGTVTVTIQTGAGGTAIIGPVVLAVSEPYTLPLSPSELRGWAETAAGSLLNMALNAGTQVGGVVRYCLVPTGSP